MKRTQLNLALAVVAAGLGATVLLSQKKEAPKGEPLTPLKPEAIEHVVIAHPGKPEIHLDKQNGRWMLTAPVTADTDLLNINGVLAVATSEVKTKLNPAEVQKSALGLDPPGYTVKFNDTVVQFGGVESLRYQRYVAVGDHIDLIDDPPSTTLDEDYSDLVSKALLPEKAEIRKIEVPGLSLTRSADGKGWEAVPAGASAKDLQALADAWSDARAMWCQYDSAPTSPEVANGQPVTITLKDRTLQFRIVSRDPQFVLAAPDLRLRYTLGKTETDKLLQLPASKPPASASTVASPAGAVVPVVPPAGGAPAK